jgi:hypothetical protein
MAELTSLQGPYMESSHDTTFPAFLAGIDNASNFMLASPA